MNSVDFEKMQAALEVGESFDLAVNIAMTTAEKLNIKEGKLEMSMGQVFDSEGKPRSIYLVIDLDNTRTAHSDKLVHHSKDGKSEEICTGFDVSTDNPIEMNKEVKPEGLE